MKIDLMNIEPIHKQMMEVGWAGECLKLNQSQGEVMIGNNGREDGHIKELMTQNI